jgi:hypothetical protein
VSRSRRDKGYCPSGKRNCFCCSRADLNEVKLERQAPAEVETGDDTFDTIRECLLCGAVAPEWQLCWAMCPHSLE